MKPEHKVTQPADYPLAVTAAAFALLMASGGCTRAPKKGVQRRPEPAARHAHTTVTSVARGHGPEARSGRARPGAAVMGADTRRRAATGEVRAAAKPRPGGAYQWTFERTQPGTLPAGFHARVGRWTTVTDASAPSGPRALAQEAKGSDAQFNVLLLDAPRPRNLDLSVRLRAVAGRIDQGGGLVWRARDEKNYYVARYNPLEDNYRVYTVKAGLRHMLASARVRVDHKAWHEVRVTMLDARIQCFLDGKRWLNVRDHTFDAAGHIGLWTKADAQTHFDQLLLRQPIKTASRGGAR